MRVLLVTRRFTWARAGGGEVDAQLIAGWLARHGHLVDVLAVETGEAKPGETPEGLRVLQVPALTTRAIKDALRATRYDLLHSYNMEGSPECVRAGRTMRVPVVVTANSAWATCLFADMYRPGHGICETCTVTGVKQCFERRPPEAIGRRVPAVLGWGEVQRRLFFLKRATRVVVLSEASRRLLTRNGIPDGIVRVVPTFTKQAFGASAPAQREGENVLYAGALTFPKGTDVLVRAFGRVAKRRPQARLQFIGRGAYQGELEKLAEQEGVRDRVDFVGYVPHQEAPSLYRKARVFAFPVRSEEAFANVILESWASDLPIVAAKVSAPGDIIEHERTGLLVPSEDPDALAEAIVRVLEDDTLAKRLVEGGRARLPHYAMDPVMERLLGVYHEAVAANGPRA